METLIGLHLARLESGRKEPLHRFLRQRDLYRDLKLDVSYVNLFLIDDLEALFPKSLYVITIRHSVDWLRSVIDDSLGRESSDAFRKLRDYRFNASLELPEEEKALQDRGLYTIRGI